MSVLTPQQAVDACYQAGFRYNQGIVYMPAIGWAESRLRTDARHTNADGSIDRGWLQINDRAHPEVTDAMADDPVQAAVAGFRISTQGTNFRPWSAYTSGAYRGPEQLTWMLFTQAAAAYMSGLQIDQLLGEVSDDENQITALQRQLADANAEVNRVSSLLTVSNNKIAAARADLA